MAKLAFFFIERRRVCRPRQEWITWTVFYIFSFTIGLNFWSFVLLELFADEENLPLLRAKVDHLDLEQLDNIFPNRIFFIR
jgi:hypothetical protein